MDKNKKTGIGKVLKAAAFNAVRAVSPEFNRSCNEVARGRIIESQARGALATVIAGAADGAQHAKIFTSNSVPEILENTVRHVYKLASEAQGNTGMAVALGEIEGFTGVVVEYLDREPVYSRFVAIRRAVMDQGECVATAKSKTFAKRIANALNKHVPNREGV